jgi:D-alanine-D-alanine ligase
MSQKKNIAVISGGNSSEYVISVQSAKQVAEALDENKYEPFIVEIKRTDWFITFSEKEIAYIDKNDFSFERNGVKTLFHCALIMIHGDPGEDGKLQGYFDMLSIPYTTGGVLSMSLTFNKHKTKELLRPLGIPMAKEILLNSKNAFNGDEVIEAIGLPCFVKPNNAGSSFGVTRVNTIEEFSAAVGECIEEDAEIMVEQLLKGTEVTCGIIHTSKNKYLLPVTEIVSETDFFDFEAKYEGLSQEITPARISEAEKEECNRLTSLVYNKCCCKGICRVDFIIQDGVPHLLEINTVPGMSEASIIPQQIREAGLSLRNILSEIIEDSIAGEL